MTGKTDNNNDIDTAEEFTSQREALKMRKVLSLTLKVETVSASLMLTEGWFHTREA